MKRLISERKWDRLIDQIDTEYRTKVHENGDHEYTADNFEKALNKMRDLNDYTIIGVKHQIEVVKSKIHDYKLRHLKLGKVCYDSKEENSSFHIEGMSWDMHWQLDRYLAIIIRDYLRFFAANTPAIGNCILEDNPEGLSYEEACNNHFLDFEKRWKDKLVDVANEFDALSKMVEGASPLETDEYYKTYEQQIALAFKDLAYIFKDLSW